MRASRRGGRRSLGIGVAVTAALTVTLVPVASSAGAHGRSEPIDVRQGRTIGRAAETNSLNGISVSPVDDRVYVASVGGDEITVHDPRTGRVVDRLGPERGVDGPDDVFVTSDGVVYWTEILTGFVGKYDPNTGESDEQFVGPGVNPITMSDDEERLFVNRLFLGSGLYELDPDFEEAPVLLNADLNINSFDFGPDGLLYAPSFFTGQVITVDVDDPLAAPGIVEEGFRVPSAVKFDSTGRVYVADLAEGEVIRLNPSGPNEVLVDIEGTIDNIALDRRDRLFVAAGVDNQIIKRVEVGRSSWTRALNRQGLGLPGGVAVSPDGAVWVAEFFGLRGFERSRRNASTSFYDRFDPPGVGFAGAATVSADGDDLILSNGFSNAVQILDPDTGDILFDTRALAGPTNAIRHDGKIVASQLGAPGLVPAGVVNAEDPSEVFIDGLAVPVGLASDGETLYVGDWALGTVFAVDDAGVTELASGLAFPEGIAVDGDRLLVVETGAQQVTAIDRATGEKSPVIVGLDYSDRVPDNFFPYGNVSGVTVDDRSIYVSDDGVNQVYEFRKAKR